MLKNILIGIFAAILVVAIGTAAYNVIGVNAAGNPVAAAAGFGPGNGRGNGGNGQGGAGVTGTGAGNGNGTGVTLANIPASDLNADETAALLFMREEEKLARDVYTALAATWNVPNFQNISASEQSHMDEIALLLTRYNLADPAQGAGVFTNATLQDLYTKLVAQGSQSLAEAYKVGGAIEEIDIRDLQADLAKTDNADIQQVFNNLMSGSYNHLNAFAGAYTNQTGTTYTAQYLPADALTTILSGATGNGNGNRGGNGQANGSGVPQAQAQANIGSATTIQGTISAYNYGTLTIQTADGQAVAVQLGNSTYADSIGFAPQTGQGVTVYGFTGDQGLFSAITVTLDNGQVYTFRESTGRPAWAGGKGKGGGNH